MIVLFQDAHRHRVRQAQKVERGSIDRLFADYGFIRTPEGAEYYFHESNVQSPAFDELKIGSLVSFARLKTIWVSCDPL